MSHKLDFKIKFKYFQWNCHCYDISRFQWKFIDIFIFIIKTHKPSMNAHDIGDKINKEIILRLL